MEVCCATDPNAPNELPSLQFQRRQRKISVSTRLSMPQETRIDKLRNEIQISEFAVPGVMKPLFPKFNERLLESKFPDVIGGMGDGVYYTRGKLGHDVLEDNGPKPRFKIEDEYNLESVLKLSSYDPLHDPNLAHFISRPTIKPFLVEQGLLKDEDHVVCSLEKFNEFRKCSGAVQKGRLAELIRNEDRKTLERQQHLTELKSLAAWKEARPKQNSKDVLAKRKDVDEQRRSKLLDVFKRNKVRREQADRVKADIFEAMRGCSNCRENMRRVAYDRVKLPQIEQRKNLIKHILQKEETVEYRRIVDKIIRRRYKRLKEEYQNQTKINAQLQNQGVLEKVQQFFQSKLKGRAEEYRELMRKKWEQLPNVIVARREAEEREIFLMRKYFYRWLHKVRDRRKRRKAAGTTHGSHWDVSDTMDKVNDDLCEERVKIVDIKTLIKAAKQQIAIEEAKTEQTKKDEEDEERVIFKQPLNQIDPKAKPSAVSQSKSDKSKQKKSQNKK